MTRQNSLFRNNLGRHLPDKHFARVQTADGPQMAVLWGVLWHMLYIKGNSENLER